MIRRFRDYDIERVVDIWLEGNVSAHGFISADYWIDNAGFFRQVVHEMDVYVYEQMGSVVGFVAVDQNQIAALYVVAPYRDKGLGKQFVEYIKNMRDTLSLQVYQKNHKAIDFFHREGFFIDDEAINPDTGELEFTMCWFKCPPLDEERILRVVRGRKKEHDVLLDSV